MGVLLRFSKSQLGFAEFRDVFTQAVGHHTRTKGAGREDVVSILGEGDK